MRRRTRFTLPRIFVLVAGIALAACGPGFDAPEPPPGTGDPAVVMSVQGGHWRSDECPNHESFMPMGEDTFRISVAPSTQDIPEFHDCQRLHTSGAFGPLVGIWAAESQSPIPAASFARPEGVIVAEVHNFTAGTSYPELHIGEGKHCVYLYHNAAEDSWTSRIAPFGRTVTCPDRFPPGEGAALVVHRRTPSSDPADYPAVARWDRNSSHHFMAVRCLSGWCEIGGDQTDTSPHYTGAAQRIVKGWYDEQFIAVVNPAGILIPNQARATAFPHADLGSYTEADFDCSGGGTAPCPIDAGWKPVARVEMHGLAPGYRDKLNLTPAGADFEIRFDPNAVDATARWQARITAPGRVIYRKVVRTRHEDPAFEPPATARWRWRSNDETLWVRCALGCCDVTAEDTGFGGS